MGVDGQMFGGERQPPLCSESVHQMTDPKAGSIRDEEGRRGAMRRENERSGVRIRLSSGVEKDRRERKSNDELKHKGHAKLCAYTIIAVHSPTLAGGK